MFAFKARAGLSGAPFKSSTFGQAPTVLKDISPYWKYIQRARILTYWDYSLIATTQSSLSFSQVIFAFTILKYKPLGPQH